QGVSVQLTLIYIERNLRSHRTVEGEDAICLQQEKWPFAFYLSPQVTVGGGAGIQVRACPRACDHGDPRLRGRDRVGPRRHSLHRGRHGVGKDPYTRSSRRKSQSKWGAGTVRTMLPPRDSGTLGGGPTAPWVFFT